MSEMTLESRVETLEQKVTEMGGLPVRFEAVEGRLVAVEGRLEVVEGQIVQLRTEMRDGFFAINHGLRDELRAEIRAGDEETRRYMRVLYEDLIERIERIGEGLPRRRPKR